MTRDGLQESDWEHLRRAYTESVGPLDRTPKRYPQNDIRDTTDGGTDRHPYVYADEPAGPTEDEETMEYSAHGLRGDLRLSPRRTHHHGRGKSDIDSIATVMAALCAMILTGTLLARYWLVLFPQ